MSTSNYIGRFAPSPTGALHFGSLVAALASFLDCKANGGLWLVRMEDLDTDRVRPGAAAQILRDLESFGLYWDGDVVHQSQRRDVYEAAFERLRAADLLYPCSCSRKDAAGRYPGSCASGLPAGKAPRAWRVRVPSNAMFTFEDGVLGCYSQNVHAAVGDFIVRRADGPFAYQLAVVADDAAQGITHIIRGADLLDNTPRQIYLQKTLGFACPCYAHVPVAVDASGMKLSKSVGSSALDRSATARELVRALAFLGQPTPPHVGYAPVREILHLAVANWSLHRVPKVPALIF